MKAAVCYEFGKPLVVEEVRLDPPQAGEVKAKIVACAICHSDVHWVRGEWGGTVPVVAGHEPRCLIGLVSRVRVGVRWYLADPLLWHCFYCTLVAPTIAGSFAMDGPAAHQNGQIVQAMRAFLPVCRGRSEPGREGCRSPAIVPACCLR